MSFIRYGLQWQDGTPVLETCFYMIRQSDEFLSKQKVSRADLYLEAHRMLWPEDDQHRWFILGMTRIVENQVTVLMGPASSAKTHTMSCHALITFFVHPHNSFGMISSTEGRSLEIKVWGRIKGLYNRAKSRFPWLPGYVLDAAKAITASDIDEENELARQLNTGLICVPCVSGGKFVGMSKFQGVKPPHSPGKADGLLAHYGDEAATMQHSFLDGYSNWLVNGAAFKGVMSGNPTDISDPLCVAAEPVGGWDEFSDEKTTQEWRSRWHNAAVIAFDGRDTPNNDDEKKQYPYLITKRHIESLVSTYGEDSWQYFQQGIGKPSRGMVSNRVITMAQCERNNAFDSVTWDGSDSTTIFAIDPAFGGGDRCVAGKLKFGKSIDGIQILEVGKPEIIPVAVNSRLEASEQIAAWVKDKCEKLSIPPEKVFYDSLGSTQLGFAFSKVYGSNCPVPVESGGLPTERPVRFDLYVSDSNASGGKRLKTCREQYKKLISEMWFSTAEAILSGQVRGLPREVALEGQLRMFEVVNNKMEVESKEDMKERVKKSPDLYDWFAIGVEGARRLGFKIQRIGSSVDAGNSKTKWLQDLKRKRDELYKGKQLKAA